MEKWDDYKKKITLEQELTAKELFENQNIFDFRACGIVYMGNEFTGFYKIEQNGEKYKLSFFNSSGGLSPCKEGNIENNCLMLNPDDKIELRCRELYEDRKGGRRKRRTRRRKSHKRNSYKRKSHKRRGSRRR
uniref:Uncharacterized protein n=1 Tax=viral metagenome TaxID=1070528 RepID=A0A6C0JIT8_9ZZZZ